MVKDKDKEVGKSEKKRIRLFPPIPKGFDAEKATNKDLLRYGIPLRPDPNRQPDLTVLWDQHVRRHRNFEQLKAAIASVGPAIEPPVSAFGLFPRETCGYELTSPGPHFTVLSGRWTVPNLSHVPSPQSNLVFFHTFFSLGFLDVHVEMTVDPAQNVTAQMLITDGQLNLPVRPGDSVSATLCLTNGTARTAAYFLANETTAQRMSLSMPTSFPLAHTVNAGISRGHAGHPFNPLAGFGTVYFDELSAYTTNGMRLLTDGVAISMVENGKTLAQPVRLNDFAFKIIHN